jgi:hypothetical protein
MIHRIRNISNKRYRENQNARASFNKVFSPENRAFYKAM